MSDRTGAYVVCYSGSAAVCCSGPCTSTRPLLFGISSLGSRVRRERHHDLAAVAEGMDASVVATTNNATTHNAATHNAAKKQRCNTQQTTQKKKTHNTQRYTVTTRNAATHQRCNTQRYNARTHNASTRNTSKSARWRQQQSTQCVQVSVGKLHQQLEVNPLVFERVDVLRHEQLREQLRNVFERKRWLVPPHLQRTREPTLPIGAFQHTAQGVQHSRAVRCATPGRVHAA